jgi:hypothetical protein
MNQEKYIDMDVHQATISVAVMDAHGKLIMECLLGCAVCSMASSPSDTRIQPATPAVSGASKCCSDATGRNHRPKECLLMKHSTCTTLTSAALCWKFSFCSDKELISILSTARSNRVRLFGRSDSSQLA